MCVCVCSGHFVRRMCMDWTKWTFFCFEHKTKPETYFYPATRPVRKDTRIHISTHHLPLSTRPRQGLFYIYFKVQNIGRYVLCRIRPFSIIVKCADPVFLFFFSKPVWKNTINYVCKRRTESFHQSVQ